MIKARVFFAMVCVLFIARAASAADADMMRIARRIGAVCGVDMRSEQAVKDVMRQPAFFWALAQAAQAGGNLSPIVIDRVQPAIKCSAGKIFVDEKAAATLLSNG